MGLFFMKRKKGGTMVRQITQLQKLYWKKESLQNARWGIDRQINAVVKHGKRPVKLLAKRAAVIMQIESIATQMRFYESP